MSAIAFFCVAGLAGLSMVFTLVFGLYGTVGGTIYVAAKAASNARLEVSAELPRLLIGQCSDLIVAITSSSYAATLNEVPCSHPLQTCTFRFGVGRRGWPTPVH